MSCPECGNSAPCDPSYGGRLCPECQEEKDMSERKKITIEVEVDPLGVSDHRVTQIVQRHLALHDYMTADGFSIKIENVRVIKAAQ